MPTIFKSKTFFNCLIFIILFVALFLRLKIITTQNVTSIETFTLLEVIKNPTLIELVEADDSIPPLQYLIVRFISWFSTELFWLRVPNLLFFTVIFFIIVDVVKKRGKLMTLVALMLFSFSPYQLEHHWESYVYLLFQFWAAVNLYAFYKLAVEKLKKNRLVLWSIIFVLTNLCGFFTHYSYIWFILAEGIYLLFLFIQKRFFSIKVKIKYKRPLVLVLITAFILALYLPVFFSVYHTALENISWFSRLKLFDIGYNFLAIFGIYNLWHYVTIDRPYTDIVGLVILSFFLIFSILRLKKNKQANLINDFGFFLTLSSILLVFLVSKVIGQSILEKRTLIALSLVAIIYLADLIVFGLKQKMFIKILTICLTSLLFLHYFVEDKQYLKEQFYTAQETTPSLVEFAHKEKIQALLFLKPVSCEYPQDKNGMFHLEFDYYWYGYDGSVKKPPYFLIRDSSYSQFFKKKDYWIIGNDCDLEKNKHLVEDQCLSIGKKYVIGSIGFLIECKNEVDLKN